eukprot:jgi/Hompol1/3353/HPOL_003213-RA
MGTLELEVLRNGKPVGYVPIKGIAAKLAGPDALLVGMFPILSNRGPRREMQLGFIDFSLQLRPLQTPQAIPTPPPKLDTNLNTKQDTDFAERSPDTSDAELRTFQKQSIFHNSPDASLEADTSSADYISKIPPVPRAKGVNDVRAIGTDPFNSPVAPARALTAIESSEVTGFKGGETDGIARVSESSAPSLTGQNVKAPDSAQSWNPDNLLDDIERRALKLKHSMALSLVPDRDVGLASRGTGLQDDLKRVRRVGSAAHVSLKENDAFGDGFDDMSLLESSIGTTISDQDTDEILNDDFVIEALKSEAGRRLLAKSSNPNATDDADLEISAEDDYEDDDNDDVENAHSDLESNDGRLLRTLKLGPASNAAKLASNKLPFSFATVELLKEMHSCHVRFETFELSQSLPKPDTIWIEYHFPSFSGSDPMDGRVRVKQMSAAPANRRAILGSSKSRLALSTNQSSTPVQFAVNESLAFAVRLLDKATLKALSTEAVFIKITGLSSKAKSKVDTGSRAAPNTVTSNPSKDTKQLWSGTGTLRVTDLLNAKNLQWQGKIRIWRADQSRLPRPVLTTTKATNVAQPSIPAMSGESMLRHVGELSVSFELAREFVQPQTMVRQSKSPEPAAPTVSQQPAASEPVPVDVKPRETGSVRPMYFHLQIRSTRALSIVPSVSASSTFLYLVIRLFSSQTTPIQTAPIVYEPPFDVATGHLNVSPDFQFECTLPLALTDEFVNSSMQAPIVVEVHLIEVADTNSTTWLPWMRAKSSSRLLGLIRLPLPQLIAAVVSSQIHLSSRSIASDEDNMPIMMPNAEYAIVDPFSGIAKGWATSMMAIGTWATGPGDSQHQSYDPHIEDLYDQSTIRTPLIAQTFTPLYDHGVELTVRGLDTDLITWIRKGGTARGRVWHRIPSEYSSDGTPHDVLLGVFQVPLQGLLTRPNGIQEQWFDVVPIGEWKQLDANKSGGIDNSSNISIVAAVQASVSFRTGFDLGEVLDSNSGQLLSETDLSLTPSSVSTMPTSMQLTIEIDKVQLPVSNGLINGTLSPEAISLSKLFVRWRYPVVEFTASGQPQVRWQPEQSDRVAWNSAHEPGLWKLAYHKSVSVRLIKDVVTHFRTSLMEIQAVLVDSRGVQQCAASAWVDLAPLLTQARLARRAASADDRHRRANAAIDRQFPLICVSSCDLGGATIHIRMQAEMTRSTKLFETVRKTLPSATLSTVTATKDETTITQAAVADVAPAADDTTTLLVLPEESASEHISFPSISVQVTVERATHLPLMEDPFADSIASPFVRDSELQTVPPNAFVMFSWQDDAGHDKHTSASQEVMHYSRLIPAQTNPSWNYQTSISIARTSRTLKMIKNDCHIDFSVYHVPKINVARNSQRNDLSVAADVKKDLIGVARVSLRPLFGSMSEIHGWYPIKDMQGSPRGQMKKSLSEAVSELDQLRETMRARLKKLADFGNTSAKVNIDPSANADADVRVDAEAETSLHDLSIATVDHMGEASEESAHADSAAPGDFVLTEEDTLDLLHAAYLIESEAERVLGVQGTADVSDESNSPQNVTDQPEAVKVQEHGNDKHTDAESAVPDVSDSDEDSFGKL